MENTIENKAKFFARYWGENVLRFRNSDETHVVTGRELDHLMMGDYLILNLEQCIEIDGLTIQDQINYGWLQILRK